MRKALVAFATKYGSTAEIASAIADELRASQIETDLVPADEVRTLGDHDLIVIGSGVYAGRWHRDAIDLLKRCEQELRAVPTWLFSSGPTGGPAKIEAALADALAAQGPAPGEAGRRAARIGIRGHALFAGKVGPNVGGIFTRWIPKGDWRDFGAIRAWARTIAETVTP